MALPSLNTSQVRKIERLIATWNGKLTWVLLIESIESDLKIKTTRQTLNTYSSIKSAYDLSKQRLRGVKEKFVNITVSEAEQLERLERQHHEIEHLQHKIDTFTAFYTQLIDKASTSPLLMQLLREIKAEQQK
ncbi:hypothetical protein AB4181_01225 [Vibrio lentus]